MNEAPDYAEPIKAWRVWKIVREGRDYSLGSMVQPTVWPAAKALAADCLQAPSLFSWLRRKRRHDAPEADRMCGIYAVTLDGVEE